MPSPIRTSKIRRWFQNSLFLLLYFVPGANWIQAQAYKLSTFSQDQGLSNQYIYNLLQDKNGFLWIGTGEGLVRFDGASFRTWHREDGIADDFVRSSFRDSRGNLWFGHFNGSISIWDGRGFTIADTSLHSQVIGFGETRDGAVWAATQREGLIRFKEGTPAEKFLEGIETFILYAFAVTRDGNFIIGTDAGAFFGYPKQKGLEAKPVTGFPEAKANALAFSNDRRSIFIGTDEGVIYRYLNGRADQLLMKTSPADTVGLIQSIWEDSGGNLWAGTASSGFYKFRQDSSGYTRIRNLDPSDPLRKENITCVFEDKHGQIWMGTFGKGLICLSPEKFSLFHPAMPGNESHNVTSVLEDRSGNLWFGTDAGLLRISSSSLSAADLRSWYSFRNLLPLTPEAHLTVKNGLPENTITALHQDAGGTIWAGTLHKGVIRIDPATLKVSPFPYSSLELSNAVNDIESDKEGNIWIGTRDGAFRYQPESNNIEYYSTRNGLTHNNISALFLHSSGFMWLATHSNKISRFDGNSFQPHEIESEFTIPEIKCLTEDSKGNIWYGTDGTGMFRQSGSSFEHFASEDGIVSNYVYLLCTDAGNDIWAAHRSGLTRFLQETKTFITYPYREHFPLQETSLNSVFKDKEGNLWFGTTEGVIRYQAKEDPHGQEAPLIMISELYIGDTSAGLPEKLVLPYDRYRLKFSFIGLSFVNQEFVKYKYKLVGRDIDWSEPSSQAEAAYQGLSDGTYTFQVVACNKQGIWNTEPATFTFTISLPWWKRWWFIALCVLSGITFIYLFVRYRTWRLKSEKEKLERIVQERTRELKEQKEKVEAANLELEKLSLVARETDNAVFIIEPDGTLEYLNPGFTRITGYTVEEFRNLLGGKSVLDISTNQQIKKVLETSVREERSIRYESKLPSKSGREIWVISTLTAIKDADGNVKKIVVIDSDISERKQAEEKVKNMNAELERQVQERTRELLLENEEHIKTAERLKEINRELDTFVYRASHDLKGPLASLIGLVDVSKIEVKDATALRYIELIGNTSLKLDNILMELLEAVKIKQGEMDVKEFDLSSSLRTLAEKMARRDDGAALNWQVQMPEGITITTDRELLLSIVTNLLDNCIKYRDTNKAENTAILRASETGGEIRIEVEDNGKGIAPELHDRVFEMFFRADTNSKGTGLGLYIARSSVLKLNGTISLQSQPGKGSTFILTFPKVFVPRDITRR